MVVKLLYLSHTGIRKSSCLWNPLQGPAQEFMQSYAFQHLELIMSFVCSPNSTLILDAYVVQKNTKEFLSQIFPWGYGCWSGCSQQKMHGKSLRTVFDLSFWICSKTHWNKKRDSHHLGTSDYRREDLKKQKLLVQMLPANIGYITPSSSLNRPRWFLHYLLVLGFFAHYFTELITWKEFKEYLNSFMTSCITCSCI